jgi:hypothetical protein
MASLLVDEDWWMKIYRQFVTVYGWTGFRWTRTVMLRMEAGLFDELSAEMILRGLQFSALTIERGLLS